ncbi:hypothetical protein L1987_31760 [Smallanthus sonchifolius]|uniref:Uncharacterized protein n=1 Tax=Smallanthus sonchifolius TaxID=185202 RepID=A0ACB9I5T6_9ASTR|nr:hypothetical protein L1987_31760 [Smallanthus sonchifolius]
MELAHRLSVQYVQIVVHIVDLLNKGLSFAQFDTLRSIVIVFSGVEIVDNSIIPYTPPHTITDPSIHPSFSPFPKLVDFAQFYTFIHLSGIHINPLCDRRLRFSLRRV